MRITGFILNDFNLIKDTGITEMTATFTSDIQAIVGTNGSGKSSTLAQMSTYPPVRSLFGKKGFKSLMVEHEGHHFRLESEFEKPSSPHLFYKDEDEENLNIGRTTETQKELIEEHLGITPLVDDLIMNRYNFPKWTPARRKEFLMQTNPDEIGFVLKLIKQQATAIKACRNNLSRLQTRKIMLEQDILSAENMQALQQEKESISTDLGNFQQNLMDLEVGLRTLGQRFNQVSLIDLPGLKKTVRRYRYQIAELPHISRDDHQRQLDRENILSSIAVCNQRLKEIDETIAEQSSQLIELETQYRELSFEGDLKAVDDTIDRLESDRDKLQITRPTFELSAEDLQVRWRELEVLKDKLLMFSTLSTPLLPTKKRQHREQMLSSSRYKLSSYRMRMGDLQAKLEDLNQRHSMSPADIPDQPCAKERCPLYNHFMGKYGDTEAQRQKVSAAIEKGTRKTTRLEKYTTGLEDYFRHSQPYTNQIQWLVNYAQSNPILHHLLRQMDILSVLSTNPNRITTQLHDAYDQIEQWLRLKGVMADLETAYALKSRQISSESHDTIKLVMSIDNLKQSLYDLRKSITYIGNNRRDLQKQLDDINRFSTIKEEMLIITKEHQVYLNELADHHEAEKLTLLKRGVEELRARHFLRMSEIERILRSQSGLVERYQEEVLSQISLITTEMEDRQKIEAALVQIPRKNMISFINTVFDQANRLIESIWTVPFRIEKLQDDDSLDYTFQVSGDNQSVREMAQCSEGQNEILSLTINLALRIILGYMDFPLCLDEAGRTFDDRHKQNLVGLLNRLLDDRIISQLILVNHHAIIHEGFSHSETMVIREDNIMLPPVYNLHCTFK